ncbi:unnamed protein product [Strongylus vulgaris]|uniref:Nematode cuticle collagen N-terminal domain-containing protein n=1 Tax=Strongylus vulgaris TaxID=40348 RepID=A0A3P7LQ29_STRVU|nr:unnamed protein product [Strongylus vulgaris]
MNQPIHTQYTSTLIAKLSHKVAFIGVAISTVATLVCVVSVPLLYNYMQHMQSIMQSEVDFCKSRSGNIWREITRTQVGPYSKLRVFLPFQLARNLCNVLNFSLVTTKERSEGVKPRKRPHGFVSRTLLTHLHNSATKY